jgi:hypothetical protein
MTLAQLETALTQRGVPKDAYSLSGGLPNEAYCLEQLPEGWYVYYSERGARTSLKCFGTEDEACDCLFRVLTESTSSRAEPLPK